MNKNLTFPIRLLITLSAALGGGFIASCSVDAPQAPVMAGPTPAVSTRQASRAGGSDVVDALQKDAYGIIVHKNAAPDAYIVQFKDDRVVPAGQNLILNMNAAKSLANRVVEDNLLKTVKMGHVFNAAIRGFSARMTQADAAALVKDPRVLLVEQDAYVHVDKVYPNPGWALDRIDQASPTLNNSFATELTGAGVHIYNLDQGALPAHSEFSGRLLCGANQSPDIQSGISAGCVAGDVTAISNIAIARSARYTPTPAAVSGNKIVVGIAGGSGDADLYVRKGSPPTTSSYDCRPYDSGNTETCDMSAQGAGTYYIMVYGYRAVSGLTLRSYDACFGTGQGSYGDACASGKAGPHGTATLSLSGGASAGVAKSAILHSVRTMPNSGYGLLSDQIAGFNWVLENKGSNIAVINFSIGEDGVYATEDNAIAACVDAGIFVAVAAGNAGADAAITSPGSSPDAFVVGATAQGDSVADYSNWGAAVDIWAPGSNVRVATDGSATAFSADDGTSFAAPLAAGVAALYRGQNPNATVAEVKRAMLNAAANGKISGNLGPAGNAAPNLLLQSFGTRCGDSVCNGAETAASCAGDCQGGAGGNCPGANCTTWPQTNLSIGRNQMAPIGTITCNNPQISAAGGSPDADLYVKVGGWPSYASKNCVSESSSNTEACSMTQGNVKYFISLYGYNSAPSGVTVAVLCR